jgi:ribosomal protein S19
VPGNLVGNAVFVHNGKNFVKSYITREKVGFKFGEFAYTKKFTKKQNKVKNKKN